MSCNLFHLLFYKASLDRLLDLSRNGMVCERNISVNLISWKPSESEGLILMLDPYKFLKFVLIFMHIISKQLRLISHLLRFRRYAEYLFISCPLQTRTDIGY